MSLIPRKSEILIPESFPKPGYAGDEPGVTLSRLPGIQDGGRGARVLLIHTGHLGDTVMALAAMRRARATLPNADIRALVIPPVDQLLRACDWLDDVIVLPRLSAARSPMPYLKWLGVFGQVTAFRPHLSVSYVPDPEGQVFLAASAAPIRVGPAKGHNWIYTRAWMTHALGWQVLSPSRFERYEKIADHAGFITSNRPGLEGLKVDQDVAEGAEQLLQDADLLKITLLISGSKAEKCWPLESYVSLVRLLSITYGMKPILVTGPTEKSIAPKLRSQLGDKAVFVDNQPLPVLAQVLKASDLVVSVDSGPGHIAAALGRPMVYIAPTKNVTGFVPTGERIRVVNATRLSDINVEQVMSEIEASIARVSTLQTSGTE